MPTTLIFKNDRFPLSSLGALQLLFAQLPRISAKEISAATDGHAAQIHFNIAFNAIPRTQRQKWGTTGKESLRTAAWLSNCTVQVRPKKNSVVLGGTIFCRPYDFVILDWHNRRLRGSVVSPLILREIINSCFWFASGLAAGSGQQNGAYTQPRNFPSRASEAIKQRRSNKNPGSFIAFLFTSRIRGVTAGVFVSRARFCRPRVARFSKLIFQPTASCWQNRAQCIDHIISGRDWFQPRLQNRRPVWPLHLGLPKAASSHPRDRFSMNRCVEFRAGNFSISTLSTKVSKSSGLDVLGCLHHPPAAHR